MSIESNVAERKAAERLHATIGELLREEVPKLPSGRSREIFWQMMHQSIWKNIPAEPEPEECKKKKPLVSSASYDEAMALIAQIEDLAGSICEAGEDFADSVSAKAADIFASVDRFGGATDGQLQALENMLDGLQRWFHD